MTLNILRSRLISIGYHPSEVEYTLSEVLQHKNPDLLNQADLRIMVTMLEERMQMDRAMANTKRPVEY